jgi:hypothetical protein
LSRHGYVGRSRHAASEDDAVRVVEHLDRIEKLADEFGPFVEHGRTV